MDYKKIVSYNSINVSLLRLVSYIIDVVILSIITLLTILILVNLFDLKPLSSVIIFIIINTLYFTILESKFGFTLGKYLMGLRVIDFFGEKPSFLKSLIRNFVRIAEVNPCSPLFIISLITIFVQKYKQRVGDITANTLVISSKDLIEAQKSFLDGIKDNCEDNPYYKFELKKTLNPLISISIIFSCILVIGVYLITSNYIFNYVYPAKFDLEQVFNNKDSKVEISFSSSWNKLKTEDGEYILKARSYNYGYTDVTSVENSENYSLIDYTKMIVENIKEEYKNENSYEIYNISINGYNAYQFEFDLTEKDLLVYTYLITVVEIDNEFYQITSYCLREEYSNSENEFYKISRTFKLKGVNYDKIINYNSNEFSEKFNNYIRKYEFNKVIDEYNIWIASEPDNHKIYYEKSKYLKEYGNLEDSIYSLNYAVKLDPDNQVYLLSKLESMLEYNVEIEEIEKKLKKINKKTDKYYNVKGLIDFNNGDYDKAITNFDQGIIKNKNNLDLYINKIYSYLYQEEYEKAYSVSIKMLEIDKKNEKVYNIKGIIDYFTYKNKSALENFDKAKTIKPFYNKAYINKSMLLYNSKNYNKCMEFAEESLDFFPGDYELLLYLGDSCSMINKHEKAIEVYKKLFELYPYIESYPYYIAREYYYIADYAESRKYIDEVKKISPKYELALLLEAELDSSDDVVGNLSKFIDENYLYADDIQNIEKTLDVVDGNKINNAKIRKFIEEIKKKDDQFTFFVDGEEYEYLKNMENTDSLQIRKESDNTYYMKIDYFTNTTGTYVIEALENIDTTDDKSLIIDLRDNPGGVLEAPNDILDVLLPECTTSYTIDKDGGINDFKSDPYQIKFKQIFILVNKNSASSSELLTLGLKKYLKNVTVIGEPTFGKGVGQIVYEDVERKFYIYLVNFYWNVKEENIAGSRIEPDILIKSDNLKDYLNEINKIIN